MYAISEEDSFLLGYTNDNHAEQLAQVSGFYERHQSLASYYNRSIENVRMSYCMRLCKEKERLGKSLWELDNRKRRLLHQLTAPSAPQQDHIRRFKLERRKHERPQNEVREQKRKSSRKVSQKVQVKFEKLEPIKTAESRTGRRSTRFGGREEANQEGGDGTVSGIEIPLFLLR